MTKLIVALDLYNRDLGELPDSFQNIGVDHFKISVRNLITSSLAEILLFLNSQNIFLDLKLYDTQDTISETVKRISDYEDVKFLTVYQTSSMLEAAMRSKSDHLKIISVGSLTDNSSSGNSEDKRALEIADGMIISQVGSVLWFKEQLGYKDKIYICPGIRPRGFKSDNHSRPVTPLLAKSYGADYIVVGRPIYNSQSPLKIAQSILNEIS
jgi:orotidine-5'-phosphate decarboxylase